MVTSMPLRTPQESLGSLLPDLNIALTFLLWRKCSLTRTAIGHGLQVCRLPTLGFALLSSIWVLSVQPFAPLWVSAPAQPEPHYNCRRVWNIVRLLLTI